MNILLQYGYNKKTYASNKNLHTYLTYDFLAIYIIELLYIENEMMNLWYVSNASELGDDMYTLKLVLAM